MPSSGELIVKRHSRIDGTPRPTGKSVEIGAERPPLRKAICPGQVQQRHQTHVIIKAGRLTLRQADFRVAYFECPADSENRCAGIFQRVKVTHAP